MTKRAGRPPIKEGQVTIAAGVRLLPEDWAACRKAAAAIGQSGVSAGLREIIAQWRRLKGE